MERIEKILAPIDFSDHAKRGLDYAVFLSRQLQATLLLVHVMQEPAVSDEEARCEIEKIGERLDSVAFSKMESGVPIETHILRGIPAVEIVKAAQNLECGLIVMGTRHGKRPSVEDGEGIAGTVVRLSYVPALVIKPPKDEEGTYEVEEREEILAGGLLR
ncbi:MAG TPA: universal stress protein [Nitrospiria bacterium]|nr:universal stress protein [Nitrospiria bacterium]